MKFEWYLALRYFRGSRKGSGFLSFIKYMAIGGVAVGSAGLLIALSIVHGFKSTINDKIYGFAADITIEHWVEKPLERIDTLNTFLDRYPQITSRQVITQGQVMIQTRDAVSGTLLKGISGDIDQYPVKNYIETGAFDLTNSDGTKAGIILGENLARQLNAELGSVITVYTVDGQFSNDFSSPEIQQFELTGIYKVGMDQFDDLIAVVHREHAQKLFGFPEQRGSTVELRIADNSKSIEFAQELKSTLGFPYYPEPLEQTYQNIFEWIDLQESLIPVLISGMIIVAAFNLIGAVLMMVLERTRDIGVLKTLGTKAKAIKQIFLMEGLLVSLIGLMIGIVISLLFWYLQTEFQIIPLSQENYYMSYAPVEPHVIDFVIVTIVTTLLCTLASWLPAKVAARTDPVKVISFGK